ncbi:MAG: DUF4091 domain-containing protein [bacterium]
MRSLTLRFTCFVFTFLFTPITAFTEVPEVRIDSREFIRSWLMCGPFPNPLAEGVLKYNHDETCLGYDRDYLKPIGGERNARPVEGQTFISADGKEFTWQRVDASSDYVDLFSLFENNQEVVIYAVCRLVTEKDQTILLGLGSNDGIKAWLNGDRVWDHHVPRSADPDFDWVRVDVRKGWDNLLLLKIEQGWGAWGFYARLMDLKEKQAQLLTEGAPAPKVEAHHNDECVRAVMGRVSRYRILDVAPPCVFTFGASEGGPISTRPSALGCPVLFLLENLSDGVYWVEGAADLPDETTVRERVYIHHGSSVVTARFYNRHGLPPKPEELMEVELLDEHLTPVSGGIRLREPGVAEILRPDIPRFRLRMLIWSQPLGRRWVVADNGGDGFTAPDTGRMEIDLPRELLRSLRVRLKKTLSDGEPMPEWIRGNLEARLAKAAHVGEGAKASSLYDTIQLLTSLKSRLPSSQSAPIWYAPNLEKIAKDEPVPSIEMNKAHISLARHEYEAFQVAICPAKDIEDVTVTFVPATKNGSASFDPENVSVSLVDYVEIEKTTDDYGTLGWWPDPLPKLREGVWAKAGENTAFWITVYASKAQASGKHQGTLRFASKGSAFADVPMEIEIYDFQLPDETHTETSFALYVNPEYHHITGDEEQRAVHDLYMRFAADHRISPRTPHSGCGIGIGYEGTPAHPVVDFSRFDRAMEKYLDEFKFTTFDIGGLPGSICGYPIYSEEYNRLFAETYREVQEHLRERGWLKRVYWYWIDEPLTYSYPDVKKGLELLKKSCPDMRRLLTLNKEKAPVPYFYGFCDLWVPLLSLYDEEAAQSRQGLGETVWWYVCCGPLAPYPNNFIDHPAINHRIRFWMMDARGVDGCLYWSATWWTQNPWDVAMSYGNGDGRLIYPPRRKIPTEIVIEGPVTSIRFEALRDGIEDREYMVLLRELARGDKEKMKLAEDIFSQIRAELVPDLSSFEMSPIPLTIMRHRLAGMIESSIR